MDDDKAVFSSHFQMALCLFFFRSYLHFTAHVHFDIFSSLLNSLWRICFLKSLQEKTTTIFLFCVLFLFSLSFFCANHSCYSTFFCTKLLLLLFFTVTSIQESVCFPVRKKKKREKQRMLK